MSKVRKFFKALGILIVPILLLAGAAAYYLHQQINVPNVRSLAEGKAHTVYIASNSSLDDVVTSFKEAKVLEDTESFLWTAGKMNLKKHIHPGKYEIKQGLNNRQLVRQLRSGKSQAVDVTVISQRTLERVAGAVGKQLEADSTEIINLLRDQQYIKDLGFDSVSIASLIVPDTYRFGWSTDAKGFLSRMKTEYDRFWNEERTAKAKKQGVSPYEAMILASIVESETNKKDEMARIAGVYLNRHRKGWKLEADPTVKFAMGNFALRRILLKHLEYDSPYNTYMYEGFPPGPICIPSKSAIKGVINAEQHKYMYFCARDDFSGYHNFARTLREHNVNARNYHKALKARGIR